MGNLQYKIKGSQPLLLEDTQTVWLVKSGSLVLFATLIEAKQQKGSRTYLFTVTAGEALFGTPLQATSSNEQRGIIAVALEETELEPLNIKDFLTKIASRDSEAIAQLDGWIQHLSQWLANNHLQQLPASVVPTQGSHFLSLLKNQALRNSSDKVLWVEVRNGSSLYLGVKTMPLDANKIMFPLGSELWIKANNLQIEVYTSPTDQLENPLQLVDSLTRFSNYFLQHFNQVESLRTEGEYLRFQEREKLNRQMASSALSQLAQVLEPKKVEVVQEENALLAAAGAVGRALGMTVLAPGRSEDLSRVKDPLDAIARASQFRTRGVMLSGKWWQKEYGPLLTYTKADNRPVALLPNKDIKDIKYLLFDPDQGSKIPVTEEVAASVSKDAYMFYRPLPQSLKNPIDIFIFGIQGFEIDIIIVILLGVIGSLLGMVTPQATAILVNDAIPDADRLLLAQLGLALFAATIGRSIFQMAQGIVTLRLENAADAGVQPAVWDRMLRLTPAFFRQYSSGDLLNRLLTISEIRGKLSGATQRTLLNGLFSILNLGLMLVYSWKLTLVALGLTIFVVIVTSVSSKLLIFKQRLQEEVDGQINGLTVELINGVAKLRVAAAEERAFAAWAKKYSQRVKLQSGIKRVDDSVTVFNEAVTLISSVLIFCFGIFFIQSSQSGTDILSVGTFLAFNSAFTTFLSGAVDLSNTLTDILEIVPLWERTQPILLSPSEYDPSKADPSRLSGRVSLAHVIFRYREDGALILDDVSIHAEPGEFIAIVGPSGSGKSTIFRLLLGFETPSSGTVYYDGQDLAGLDIQAVRRQLGVVLQNVRISSASIFDSISSGALITLDEAWQAAEMAGFAEDIRQMPMGMHTVISEGGTNLSGGQKQRLLIARALVLKPKIILMDEATSALDNRTQAIVTESLEKLNSTRIVIAHRLSTIRDADRIYVVESGRLVQVGSFDQLVSQEGLFARLVARQLE